MKTWPVIIALIIAAVLTIPALKRFEERRIFEQDVFLATAVVRAEEWPECAVDQIRSKLTTGPLRLDEPITNVMRQSISPQGQLGTVTHGVLEVGAMRSGTPKAVIRCGHGDLVYIVLLDRLEHGWRQFYVACVRIKQPQATEPPRPRRFSLLLCFLNSFNILSSTSINSESVTHVYEKGS